MVQVGLIGGWRHSDDDRLNIAAGDLLGDSAQGDGLAGAGGDLIPESLAKIVLVGGRQDQTFILAFEE